MTDLGLPRPVGKYALLRLLDEPSLGRDADTTAAIAGALAGAGRGENGVPRRWAEAIGPARGTCLPVVAGNDVRDVADALTRRR